MFVPKEYDEFFDVTYREEADVKIPFTRESWHGRMRACRGVAASMLEETLAHWDKEHRKMLESYPESFEILHYIAMAELTLK
ncbi:MAG: class I SAM-dependent methyltransferase, partial [Ruminiclostridium sp.]|nr:class I SAM-dependent methyltransferase [Ruminiclostridium sp.]